MSEFIPEDAYRLHVKQVEGENAVPAKPFMELSDMAIQMYEIEADLLNQDADAVDPDPTI